MVVWVSAVTCCVVVSRSALSAWDEDHSVNIQALLVGLIWVAIYLGVLYVVYWALTKLVGALGAPSGLNVVVQVICVLIGVLIILAWVTGNLPAATKPFH